MTSQTYIYSASAAGRMFHRPSSHIKAIHVWASVVWVHIQGMRPRFVSKRHFIEHFSLFRQVNGARLRRSGLVRMFSPGNYTVSSQSRPEKFHSVVIHDGSSRWLTCTCGDFKLQQELFQKGCCKHGYAVLQTLGFSTLKNFIER
jgi:hypothetical protein